MGKERYQLQESLCSVINRASRTIRNYFNQELLENGQSITREQSEVLVLLWNEDGKNQQRLSNSLGKDKTTVTRLIRSLEELNLVKRVKNKKDERQKLVYLTQSGKKITKRLNDISRKISVNAQKGISITDIALCKNILRRVQETLLNELH